MSDGFMMVLSHRKNNGLIASEYLCREIHRCLSYKSLYNQIVGLLPKCIKVKSIPGIMTRWFMNEKMYQIAQKDVLLPDGNRVESLLVDILNRCPVNTVIGVQANTLNFLCRQAMLQMRFQYQPVTYDIYHNSGKFTNMVKIIINYADPIVLEIPERTFNILQSKINTDKIITLALRYQVIGGFNNQLAVDPRLMNLICDKYTVQGELFASAFNVHDHNKMFCSMFPDIEIDIGSVGTFFEYIPQPGFYMSNPPYDLVVMRDMALRLVSWMKTIPNLAFMSFLPVMDPEGYMALNGVPSPYGDFECLNILRASNYIKLHKTIHQSKACFIDKMSHRYIFPCHIHIILLANYDININDMKAILDVYHANERNFIFYKIKMF